MANAPPAKSTKHPFLNVKMKIEGGGNIQMNLDEMISEFPSAIRTAMKREGLRLKEVMQTGIKREAPGGQRFKPLAETTKFLKKSSKPLIDKGDLVNSINSDVVGGGGLSVFVGVNRQARHRNGAELWNLAEIHEYGTRPYRIPITNKMRWFFAAMAQKPRSPFRPLPPGKTEIYHPGIPARPFIGPAFDEWKKDATDNIRDYVLRRSTKLKRKHGLK